MYAIGALARNIVKQLQCAFYHASPQKIWKPEIRMAVKLWSDKPDVLLGT